MIRRALAGAVVVLVALAVPAAATTGTVNDPRDTSSPVDVAAVVHRDDPATISWEVDTYGAFADSDVATCLWQLDGLDRQVGVAWDSAGRRLVALVETGSGRVIAPAHVVRTGADSMRVSVRRGDVTDPSSYRYSVTCLSDGNGDGRITSNEADAVPDGNALATHRVSASTGIDPVRRIAGADRIATAVALSQDGWKPGAAGAVVLAAADSFADALSGTPLASARRGPVLLTNPDALDSRVATEIDRVLPGGGRVYVMGGDDAISPAVVSALTARGWSVRRIAGPDRFATSVAVAGELGHPSTVLLADGTDFADGLAAGPAAAIVKGALLLTSGDTLPPAVRNELAAHPPSVRYAVGAPAAAADPGATAIVGTDRYDTSRRVAARFFTDPGAVFVTTGLAFADGLAAGARAATSGTPLVLAEPHALTSTVFGWLSSESASLGSAAVVGGTGALGDEVVVGLLDAVN